MHRSKFGPACNAAKLRRSIRLGQTRQRHSAAVPTFVRCCPTSDRSGACAWKVAKGQQPTISLCSVHLRHSSEDRHISQRSDPLVSAMTPFPLGDCLLHPWEGTAHTVVEGNKAIANHVGSKIDNVEPNIVVLMRTINPQKRDRSGPGGADFMRVGNVNLQPSLA